ncbi:MAG: Gfo/Idh/MocA family oxidoreductase, partial [Planctomycetia bacterium]|nr:Gfo/Idh/MocA family oxidoreductase [Planctomycetia bacterium]
ETIPTTLNWDLWNGPALKRDYSSIYIKRWQWFKEFGMGIMGLQGIHQIDMAHWICGLGYPKSAYCVGGNNFNPGGRNTPDTQSVVYEFDKMVVNVEQVQKLPYMLETDSIVRESDMFPYWMQNSTRVEIYGLKGLMVIGRLGAGWQVFIRTKDRKPVSPVSEYGRYPNKAHLDNFIDCMRSRKEPNAPASAAAKSTLLVHYGLISLALGSKKLDIDLKTGAILGCPEAAPLWRPEYRKPYDVPEVK